MHPRAYMVHRPHEDSAAKHQFDDDVAHMKAEQAAAEEAAAAAAAAPPTDGSPAPADGHAAAPPAEEKFSLFGAAQRWLDEQFAAPSPHAVLVSPGFKRCWETLPSWDIYSAEQPPMPTVTRL